MFDERFEVFLADTDFGKSINKQIRYRVFCLERGFEDPTAFPNGEESDLWDRHSAHFIVREKQSGRWVASTRFIFPETKLPVEQMDALNDGLLTGFQRDQIGEVSRFCIINKNAKTTSQFSHVSQPQLDWIGSIESADQFEVTQGMLRAISCYALDNGINYSYMFITKPMARLLKRLGVSLYQTGPDRQYRGTRASYLVDFNESQKKVSRVSKDVKALYERKSQAYLSIAEAEKSFGEHVQDQLEEYVSCRLN